MRRLAGLALAALLVVAVTAAYQAPIILGIRWGWW
jgi:hypothetical protein